MNKKKRSLSESSDDPDDPGVFDPSPGSGYNPLAGGYNPSAGDYSSSGGLPGFKRPKFESSGRVYPFNFFANIPFIKGGSSEITTIISLRIKIF